MTTKIELPDVSRALTEQEAEYVCGGKISVSFNSGVRNAPSLTPAQQPPAPPSLQCTGTPSDGTCVFKFGGSSIIFDLIGPGTLAADPPF